MKRNALLLSAVLLAGVPAHADWPQFRGPDGTGVSTARGIPLAWSETKNVKWKTAIHGRAWSSPIVLGSQVWLTTATEDGRDLFAVAVDRETNRAKPPRAANRARPGRHR